MLSEKWLGSAQYPYPQIYNILIANAISWDKKSGIDDDKILVLGIKTDSPISSENQAKIESWLSTRLKFPKVKLIINRDIEASKKKSDR